MRKLDKGVAPAEFESFKRTHSLRSWEETRDVSRQWREYLLNVEQHGLSGYTEQPLSVGGSHIDHFRKRNLFNTLVFDWDNLIADSNDSAYGAKYKDDYVKSREDNNRLINPAVEDASHYFKYEISGRVAVADGLTDEEKERANYTCAAFNLNEGSLVERRKLIMNTVLDAFGDLTDEEVIEALQSLGFTSVVEQLLQERSENKEAV